MPLRKIKICFSTLLVLVLMLSSCRNSPENKLPATVSAESGLIKTIHRYTFRDLNKNGKLDVYEDARQPVELRIKDLLGQMTIEEKTGMMFYTPAGVNSDGSIEDKPAKAGIFSFMSNALKSISDQHINYFNLFMVPSPDTLALWYNRMQQFTEKTRLGIPLSIFLQEPGELRN